MAKYVSSFEDFMKDMVYAETSYHGDEGYSVGDGVEVLIGNEKALKNGAEMEYIAQYGGGEGGGECCYTVFKIGDEYYKVEYSYYSHHGFYTDGSEVYLVTPQEKTITVYE